ncbi:hypothetical protein FT663_04680 [Candidozyma haemuli var. vulneris]|nr:hypothetical protein FT663_04680 [[Candida] haemuloni var. vulneris]KAF3991377.1 hypothetical protein FT662_01732 [[Candida] haemuloni var. vulneris]
MESNKTASVNDAYASPVTPTGPPRTTTNQNDKVLGSVPINWIKGIEMDLSRTSYRLKDLRNRIGLQSSKIDHVHTATQICFRSIASVEAKADEVAVICNEMRNILPGLCQLQSILIRQIGQSTADLNDFFQSQTLCSEGLLEAHKTSNQLLTRMYRLVQNSCRRPNGIALDVVGSEFGRLSLYRVMLEAALSAATYWAVQRVLQWMFP